jgi:hypothetical protein
MQWGTFFFLLWLDTLWKATPYHPWAGVGRLNSWWQVGLGITFSHHFVPKPKLITPCYSIGHSALVTDTTGPWSGENLHHDIQRQMKQKDVISPDQLIMACDQDRPSRFFGRKFQVDHSSRIPWKSDKDSICKIKVRFIKHLNHFRIWCPTVKLWGWF